MCVPEARDPPALLRSLQGVSDSSLVRVFYSEEHEERGIIITVLLDFRGKISHI
jgi:hypothetical protein